VHVVAPHVVAFTRGDALVVVPRLTSMVEKWGDLAIPLGGRWRNVFTDEVLEGLRVAEIFAKFPVAILTSDTPSAAHSPTR
jgi:maltooligosyltrehalose synthase